MKDTVQLLSTLGGMLLSGMIVGICSLVVSGSVLGCLYALNLAIQRLI